jgi:dTDP-4-amino-4,6-dideoxygalactose transaminase
MADIPFLKPYVVGTESNYIRQVIESRKFAGDGEFTGRCERWLENITGCKRAVLTPSGTKALEMMTLLSGIGPGDEVILPSFTLTSTANSIILRGATPVFVDSRADTLNIDENLIEAAITPRTKAIMPVHYAGVACEMDRILDIARKHSLLVLEDSAQCICAYYRDRHLGTIGQMGVLSFNESKNIQCGEGGALLINDPAYLEQAEIVMEWGTDKRKFMRGEVDNYSWAGVGSVYHVNEITAAFLWAQFEHADEIMRQRLKLWDYYREQFVPLEEEGHIAQALIPEGCRHNAHIFRISLSKDNRDGVISELREKGIKTTSHFVPLHSTTGGKRYSKPKRLPVAEGMARKLLRLPLYHELRTEEQNWIIMRLKSSLITSPR